MFTDDTLMYDHCSGINDESPCCRLGNDVPRLDTGASEWCTTFIFQNALSPYQRVWPSFLYSTAGIL